HLTRAPPHGSCTPSLHDALPISTTPARPVTLDSAMNTTKTYDVRTHGCQMNVHDSERLAGLLETAGYVDLASVPPTDRPTVADEIGRAHVLNSSHVKISYAVFCL